ncbi:MAG: hypothetical protein ABII22_06445 [Candidatus Micrarchaeota archaeon]
MNLSFRNRQDVSHTAQKCPSLDHALNRKSPMEMFGQKQYSAEALRPWFGSTRTRSGSYCYGYAKKGRKPIGVWSYLGWMNFYTKYGLTFASFEDSFSIGNRLSASASSEAEKTPFASMVSLLMADSHVSAFYFSVSESGESGVHVLRDQNHSNDYSHGDNPSNHFDHFASGYYPHHSEHHEHNGTHVSEHSAEHLEMNSHLSAMLAGRGHNPFADLMHTNGDHTAHMAAEEEAHAIQHAIHEALETGHNHSEGLHFVAGMHHFHSEIEVYHWYHHEHSGNHNNPFGHEEGEEHDGEDHGLHHSHHIHGPSVHGGHGFAEWFLWWQHGHGFHHESVHVPHESHEGNHEPHSHDAQGHHEHNAHHGHHEGGDKSHYGFLGHGWNSQAHPFWEYVFHHSSEHHVPRTSDSHSSHLTPNHASSGHSDVMVEHIQHNHPSEHHSSDPALVGHSSAIEDHVIAKNLAHSGYNRAYAVRFKTTGASSGSDRSN